ncbi:hypothetical protein [Nocardia transvalensis]|uniref:hypothetical protein n=1 Tax=Nocardia transvalensis TaxID=37333 RepID=UPI001E34DAE6|nr:hypothetical protein [Nocardia transvalensis]
MATGATGDFHLAAAASPAQRGKSVLELFVIHVVERQHRPQAILVPFDASAKVTPPQHEREDHGHNNPDH